MAPPSPWLPRKTGRGTTCALRTIAGSREGHNGPAAACTCAGCTPSPAGVYAGDPGSAAGQPVSGPGRDPAGNGGSVAGGVPDPSREVPPAGSHLQPALVHAVNSTIATSQRFLRRNP